MRNTELKQYIEDRKHLFWYSPSPKSETVSDELLTVRKLSRINKKLFYSFI